MKASRLVLLLLCLFLNLPFAVIARAAENPQIMRVEVTAPFGSAGAIPSTINFTVLGDYTAADQTLSTGSKYVVTVENGALQLYQIDKDTTTPILKDQISIMLQPAGDAGNSMVELDGKKVYKYREGMQFMLAGGANSSIVPINIISVENYLKGVVPTEMSDSWELEALKAQAVAARTYAISEMKSVKGDGYINDTVKYQAYQGVNIEGDHANQAVDSTQGQVLTYSGNLISALYSASNGGYTEASENVWSGNGAPYLIEKQDPYDAKISPHMGWTVTLSAADIAKKLAAANLSVGTVQNVQLLSSYPSQRVADLAVVGDKGTQHISKDRARTVFGLKSALYTITTQGAQPAAPAKVAIKGKTGTVQKALTGLRVYTAQGLKNVTSAGSVVQGANQRMAYASQPAAGNVVSVTFTGSGWGHGVGMSQWGAREMAKEDKNYLDITAFYYPGAQLSQNYGN
ncbi:SpoIID/LytB domain-containing protein [Aneurinibacillus sp. Ricciae_BoGa-3]|uniref:SpoIID/LytB domain-containing protein n=1 Tax=Aneurinibacillus sp. Ricciae_BoGa-3 TaxID=3022697 RepID=UPI002341BF3B|nr:SpoIID/LytB domain-containing protein [Aneurinibacillus sp. Ricciae_BoGa-3]WCK53618.1 SpoIID/LytB domain-containing protein [Aneurinibacillus sp. Ricciae_BoGa-3]